MADKTTGHAFGPMMPGGPAEVAAFLGWLGNKGITDPTIFGVSGLHNFYIEFLRDVEEFNLTMDADATKPAEMDSPAEVTPELEQAAMPEHKGGGK